MNDIFNFGSKTYVMGILNVTPDSFSDGGDYFNVDDAVDRALEIQEEGADILDIGAQSTRPGSAVITAEEEINRLAPVLKGLKDTVRIPISVDTYYPEVAKFAVENGAKIINDVSGKFSENMAKIVAEDDVYWIMMHNDGADNVIYYENGIIKELSDFFSDFCEKSLQYGIKKERLIFDPGIGFGKDNSNNLLLIQQLKQYKIMDCPILIAASRKRFIGDFTGEQNPKNRLGGTIAANTIAINCGADLLRVHDVFECVQAAKLTDAFR